MIVSPGSRSTPLVLGLQWVLDQQAADAGDALRAHLVLDERSAAFQAVGVARAGGRPAVLMCTSGTAAVEYHPAVVEAHLAALPLLICTADRPPELQGTGAPQTIDQRNLFGTSVRSYLEPGPPTQAGSRGWRLLADEAFRTATGLRPGPVHLNLAFREPLVGAVGHLPPSTDVDVGDHQVPMRAAPLQEPLERSVLERLVERCSGRRVVVMAGERAVPSDAPTDVRQRMLDGAASLGWPVLADPLSGLRLDHLAVVPNFDPILRSEVVARSLLPDLVIRLGGLVSSKVGNRWLAGVAEQVAVDPGGWFPDPDQVVAERLDAEPALLIERLVETLDHRRAGVTFEGPDRSAAGHRLKVAPPAWTDRWRRVSQAVAEELYRARPDVVESAALAAALDGVPAGGHLVVSSSMPVRDLEWFGPQVPAGVTVHSNRGANGIDGVIATAVGVAHTGAPTVAVVGDLAMLHDVGSLISAAAVSNLAVVVIDNGGGGIFSFLSQHELLPDDQFERWWGTPSGVDVVAAASGLGLEVADVRPSELAGELQRRLAAGLSEGTAATGGSVAPRRRTVLCRVVSNRETNLVQHQRLLSKLAASAEAALGIDP